MADRRGYVYRREDRQKESWRSSRRPSPPGRTGRLLLLDIALLAIAAGVLVPWAQRQRSTLSAGPYQIRWKQKQQEEAVLYTLSVSLSSQAETEEEEEGVLLWRILDQEETELHREADLLPSPGGIREFFVLLPPSQDPLTFLVQAGSHKVSFLVDH